LPGNKGQKRLLRPSVPTSRWIRDGNVPTLKVSSGSRGNSWIVIGTAQQEVGPCKVLHGNARPWPGANSWGLDRLPPLLTQERPPASSRPPRCKKSRDQAPEFRDARGEGNDRGTTKKLNEAKTVATREAGRGARGFMQGQVRGCGCKILLPRTVFGGYIAMGLTRGARVFRHVRPRRRGRLTIPRWRRERRDAMYFASMRLPASRRVSLGGCAELMATVTHNHPSIGAARNAAIVRFPSGDRVRRSRLK